MSKETNSYRILVIEDNPGDYFLLEQNLQLSKLRVEKTFHAENMATATALVKDNSFDIAMLDLTLPDSTGVDSVITLNRLLPKTPIIVLSGLSTIEIATKSISLGAQDYLMKGEFDEKLLAKSVLYSIERKKQPKNSGKVMKDKRWLTGLENLRKLTPYGHFKLVLRHFW